MMKSEQDEGTLLKTLRMTAGSLLMLVLIGCGNDADNHSRTREIGDVASIPTPTLTLPDSFFPYSRFSSTTDTSMFVDNEYGFRDTLANHHVLQPLSAQFRPIISGPISRALQIDSQYIEKMTELFPVAKVKSPKGSERLIFVLRGDDLWGQILIHREPDQMPGYAVFLAGGVSAGPDYEDDSVWVAAPAVRSVIRSDTLIKSYLFSAEFFNKPGQSDTAKAPLLDSGTVILRLGPKGVDTLQTSGIVQTEEFLKIKLGVTEHLSPSL